MADSAPDKVVVENNALSNDEEEFEAAYGNRPVKTYPVNPVGPKVLDEGGTPITSGGKVTMNPSLGRGSTGRATPNTLKEQLSMEQAMSNHAKGIVLPVPMTDSRWPMEEGWVKMSQNINGIEIHYVRNTETGQVDDFKFK